MLENYNILSDLEVQNIIKYLQNNKLEEKDYKMIDDMGINEIIKEKIMSNVLTTFYYDNPIQKCQINSEIHIEPIYDGSNCIFTISPDLADGMFLNKQTGEICGRSGNDISDKEYTVTCKNVWNELSFVIKIHFDSILL